MKGGAGETAVRVPFAFLVFFNICFDEYFLVFSGTLIN
nr:MAG TPA: hypothetical protein [Caudoviricetes sp.]